MRWGRMRAAWTSFRISEEPAWPLTTFFTGQPKLMSMMAAPLHSCSLAASAIEHGSQPTSCIETGSSTLIAVSMMRFCSTVWAAG